MIYNDGYRPILGNKHPHALGLPFREGWPEVQIETTPLHEIILSDEPSAFFAENLLLKIQRHGDRWEEAHLIVSYSPIPDASAHTGVGAVRHVVETDSDHRRLPPCNTSIDHLA